MTTAIPPTVVEVARRYLVCRGCGASVAGSSSTPLCPMCGLRSWLPERRDHRQSSH